MRIDISTKYGYVQGDYMCLFLVYIVGLFYRYPECVDLVSILFVYNYNHMYLSTSTYDVVLNIPVYIICYMKPLNLFECAHVIITWLSLCPP